MIIKILAKPAPIYVHSTTYVIHTYPFIMYILAEAVCYFQKILNFHYDDGRQGLEIDPCIKFCFPQSFSLSVTCTYICQSKCIGQDCFLLFSKKHIVYIIFVRSWSFISLPSFIFVSAAVSEIRESNRNKKEKMAIFNLTPFPGM